MCSGLYRPWMIGSHVPKSELGPPATDPRGGLGSDSVRECENHRLCWFFENTVP